MLLFRSHSMKAFDVRLALAQILDFKAPQFFAEFFRFAINCLHNLILNFVYSAHLQQKDFFLADVFTWFLNPNHSPSYL